MTKNTLKSNGYKYLFYDINGYHILYDIVTGTIERWASRGNASLGTMDYKNTKIEFCNSYNDFEKQKLINTMRRIQHYGEQHPEFHNTMMNVYRKYLAK